MCFKKMEKITINSEVGIQEFTKSQIEKIASNKEGRINIGLPGGRSVKPILKAISLLDDKIIERLYFYLIDERIDSDFNADMIIEELINGLLDAGKISDEQICFPIFTNDLEEDWNLYETSLDNFDIVFVGSGEDCHFASLFPNGEINNSEKIVELVNDSPKPPKRRLTLTFKAFDTLAKDAVFIILFLGDGKKDALEHFIESDDSNNYPITYLKKFNNVFVLTDIEAGL